MILNLESSGFSFTVEPDDAPATMGREEPANIVVESSSVSRKHCELTYEDKEWFVKDLSSRYGTTVNGKPATKPTKLGSGDVLKLGNELRGGKSIGAINCEFIKTFLRTEGIPLVASGLGGNIGRNIFFLIDDFSVYVKSIEHDEEQAVIQQERRFLKKNTAVHTPQPSDQADFW